MEPDLGGSVAMNYKNSHEAGAGQPDTRVGFWGKLSMFIVPAALIFISIGEATDAGFLLHDLYVEMYGLFSNQPEYDVLDGLHVGNTEEYAQKLAGMAEVSRQLSDGSTAKYFMRGDYLLTLIIANERLAAYTVVVLDEDFTPTFDNFDIDTRELGSFTYADVPIESPTFSVDESRINRYYIESFDAGRAGRFLQTYLGSIEYGTGVVPDELTLLYGAEVGLSAADSSSVRADLRRGNTPNFYGRGELELEYVVESILTTTEFGAYFAD
jgi:hypothetical protein